MRGLPKSIRARMLLAVLGVALGVWLGTAAITWLDTRHELDELLDGHLAQAAALLVVQQAQDIDDDDKGVDAPVLHRYAPKVAFQVFHDGRLSSRSANAPITPMVNAPQAEGSSGFATVRIGDVVWRVFSTRGQEGDVQVYVGEQIASRESILWAVLRGMLWPLLLALPLLGVAIWWAVNQGLKPLRSLQRVLGQRQPDDLQPIASSHVASEIAPVFDALNGLFSRIAGLLVSERRFTADAAHELRTPIAAIRTQAQVALAESDEAARRHALEATLTGCDRAGRLVDQLLTLSRLEAGTPSAFTLVDLSAVARQVVADLAPQAIAQQQDIALEADAPQFVQGDATLLAALARNLVDNAMRYSPAGASIRVGVQAHAGGISLQVDDGGPGMRTSDMARMGERFFRVLGTQASGSGLGWSIVRRIAAAHHAEVQIAPSAMLGGLHVAVNWPGQAR